MKVDFYISSLSSGGAEHVLTNLAANFAEHGEDVSVTSYEKRPQFYSVATGIKLNKVNHNGNFGRTYIKNKSNCLRQK